MSEPADKQARVVLLDMSCPCGAMFSLEYTTGNAVLKELVELASTWATQHKHGHERGGPSESGKQKAVGS